MAAWRALLLGGTTAAGKSTSAHKLARRLAIGCIAGDAVWHAIIAMTTPETHPVLHEWPRPQEAPGDADYLADLHRREAEAMTPAIDAFLDRELMERNRFVFHAAWITPKLAARKCEASPEVRAVFLDEPKAEDILTSMVARSGRTEPNQRQVVIAEVARLYGDWLRQGALEHGLPVVPARPHETLVDRIIVAARLDDEKGAAHNRAAP